MSAEILAGIREAIPTLDAVKAKVRVLHSSRRWN
jgi:hypothetical protein